MAGHGWNVVVWSSTFVVAEEEYGILPCRTHHEGIHHIRHLNLTEQDRLARAGMLVIIGVACLNECKAGKRTVGKIGKVGRQRSKVVGIDAEAVRRIANHTGWLSGRGTGS